MKNKLDGWNIVLAGLWNRAIFTPEWVGRFLFDQTEVETYLSIMPYLPIIYKNEHVALEISSNRLVLRPLQLDDESMQVAENLAHKVLEKLQDTPLSGVGVNFAFVENSPNEELAKLFIAADDTDLIDFGLDIQERRLVRRVQKDEDVLNLTLAHDSEGIAFEFNFHTETNDNNAACISVKDRVLRLRNIALQLLENVYGLHPSEGEEDYG